MIRVPEAIPRPLMRTEKIKFLRGVMLKKPAPKEGLGWLLLLLIAIVLMPNAGYANESQTVIAIVQPESDNFKRKGDEVYQSIIDQLNQNNKGRYEFIHFKFDLLTFDGQYANADAMVTLNKYNKKSILQWQARESGREAYSSFNPKKYNEKKFAAAYVNRVSKDLNYIEELLKIRADEIIDAGNSIVQYNFNAISGEVLSAQVDFGDDHKSIQNVKFLINEKKDDGSYTYELQTLEGNVVNIKLAFEGNNIIAQSLDVDYRPKNLQRAKDKFVHIISKEGYELEFAFSWTSKSANGIKNVNVGPKINPYSPDSLGEFM